MKSEKKEDINSLKRRVKEGTDHDLGSRGAYGDLRLYTKVSGISKPHCDPGSSSN